jgi:hypothetical protein
MMTTALLAPSTPATETTLARSAFATLDPAQQRLIDAVLFDGRRCTQIAQAIGAPAGEIRSRVGAALRELRVQLAPGDGAGGDGVRHREGGSAQGDAADAVAGMLVLRALDALDADEAALVDAMLVHQPALQPTYAGDRDLVAALCAVVPHIAPPSSVLARLRGSIDGDDAN